jgi:uncharacterized protein (TIGR00255 family)
LPEIFSMTGFARVTGKISDAGITIEAKSVNHRYLDIKIRLPRELQIFEQKIVGLARKMFDRGHMDIWVNFMPGERPVSVKWNRALAEGVKKALVDMKEELGLLGEPDLALLASQKDIIEVSGDDIPDEEEWSFLSVEFERCFNALKSMRAKEGENLAVDILERIGVIEENFAKINERMPDVVAIHNEKLNTRLKELIEKHAELDPQRLATETAVMTDRCDITEEVVRAKSHIEQFRSVLEKDGPKGRKMDFIIQEIFREVNTCSNKAQDTGISNFSVNIKTELEKVREQVQNIE